MHLDNLSPIRSIGWFDSLYGAIHNDGSDSVLSYVMQGMLVGASDLLFSVKRSLVLPSGYPVLFSYPIPTDWLASRCYEVLGSHCIVLPGWRLASRSW
jgi:hypothetical protein